MPRVVGKIRRRQPVQVRDVAFLRANTERPIKITIPGPFTMTQQLFDEHYKDEAAVAMDCAIALNEEIKDLFAAGADVVQLDEPFLQAQPDKARRFGVAAINRAIDGVKGTDRRASVFRLRRDGQEQAVRLFVPAGARGDGGRPGFDRDRRVEARLLDAGEAAEQAIVLGVIDLQDMTVETPATVAERIRRALPYVPAERRSWRRTAA